MDIEEQGLDENEDFAGALSTPDVIHGNDEVVFWRNCEASILLGDRVVKKMTRSEGSCVLPGGYTLYCVGKGGQLKKKA